MVLEKTIKVSEESIEELHDRKNVGDSYDDVIQRLLKKEEQLENLLDGDAQLDNQKHENETAA